MKRKLTSYSRGLYYITCPCNCGRAVQIHFSPVEHDISEYGDAAWQSLVKEKGYDEAIAYLHQN